MCHECCHVKSLCVSRVLSQGLLAGVLSARAWRWCNILRWCHCHESSRDGVALPRHTPLGVRYKEPQVSGPRYQETRRGYNPSGKYSHSPGGGRKPGNGAEY